MLARHYDSLVARKITQENMPRLMAEHAVKSTMLRPGASRHGLDSWDIHEEYLPRLKQELPGVQARVEADWFSAESSRLKQLGVVGGEERISQGIALLYERKISQLAEQGMLPEEARKQTETDYVKHGAVQKGAIRYKVHRSAIPDLIEIMEIVPGQRISKETNDANQSTSPSKDSLPNR